MIKLHLGEEAAQYVYRSNGSVDTIVVAKILEAKYSLFTVFFEANADWIANKLGECMTEVLEAMVAGNPPVDPFEAMGAPLEERFREFLELYEVEGLTFPDKSPTKAALDGIRHVGGRRTSGSRRPSFIDTGLLKDNFRAWVEANA